MRLVMVEAVVLMVWWLWQSQGESAADTWALLSPYNVGTVLYQFAFVLLVLFLANGWLARRVKAAGGGLSGPAGAGDGGGG